MPNIDPNAVAKAVESKIEELRSLYPDVRLTVQPSEIVFSEENWTVPVHPDRDPPRATSYYDFLSSVEESVKTDHQIDVFIVPSGVMPVAGSRHDL